MGRGTGSRRGGVVIFLLVPLFPLFTFFYFTYVLYPASTKNRVRARSLETWATPGATDAGLRIMGEKRCRIRLSFLFLFFFCPVAVPVPHLGGPRDRFPLARFSLEAPRDIRCQASRDSAACGLDAGSGPAGPLSCRKRTLAGSRQCLGERSLFFRPFGRLRGTGWGELYYVCGVCVVVLT